MSIEKYRQLVEVELLKSVEAMGEKNGLRDACEYSLMAGGKRLRPILVLMIADAIGLGLDVMPAALSVEFFHTASLIVDDLPCMDDDEVRRNRPSLHKAYSEGVAVLASLTLIAAGYGGISLNARKLGTANADQVAVLCLEAATRCAGIQGATNGQYLDLYPPDSKLETIQKIIYQKTVTLFEIAFIFGWLFGGGKIELLELVKKCAYHLGMAFQIADDIDDYAQDASQECEINIAAVCGKKEALQFFEEHMAGFELSLKNLGLLNADFKKVVEWLRKQCKAALHSP